MSPDRFFVFQLLFALVWLSALLYLPALRPPLLISNVPVPPPPTPRPPVLRPPVLPPPSPSSVPPAPCPVPPSLPPPPATPVPSPPPSTPTPTPTPPPPSPTPSPPPPPPSFTPTPTPTSTSTSVPPLNSAVLAYSLRHLHLQVGDGECATLALRALTCAGAKTTVDYSLTGPDADYRWGQPLHSVSELLPGDILQYRNVEFRKSWTTTRVEGSHTITSVHTNISVAHHHTSVVETVNGQLVGVLQQNSETDPDPATRKIVQRKELDFSTKVKGTVWLFRPVASGRAPECVE